MLRLPVILVFVLKLLEVFLGTANAILKFTCGCITQQISVLVVLKTCMMEAFGSNLA
jgi:hypothetical protein